MAVILAEMEQSRTWIAIAVAMAMMVLPYNCMATNYTVGDTQGWNLGVTYTTWVSGKTFHVGDNLIFTYTSTSHDVLEVSESAYTSCSTSNALSTYNGGDNTIPLNSTGARYFICGFTGHCSGGMKVGINVTAASSNSTQSPPPPSTNSTNSPNSAAMAASYMQIKDGAVLVGSLLLGSLAVWVL